ncbi:TPA: YceI family protein [Stenotrophomonas maltophilia]|uniref:YceI family protein n=1 Tax=Stenotrophomonas sp. TaxID=69392 RepID=UPI0028B193D2|nr:YceI family protein [Stenotrophomonas sp.]HDS0950871.1 YceI family protein [Stenotrophomonas maltophilia]HDS1027153.1 YceI family protein [Stenotrophomonas maltophilia]HDS1031133.1 YceI family protein [Stenotrophomonas maltophilia]HDS1035947.1 YceI family protein [Stenotrophomonas maltophilia]HDS1040972.1 YceI family protein [Stenotrophomonas maltophilia]
MRSCLALLPLLLAAAPAWAGNDAWRIDPVHTRVLFAIDHAGYSQAMGTISGSQGRLQFDADNWRDAKLDVEIPVSRLDLGDAKWNEATLARSLLDGERFPTARFVSTQVDPIDDKRAHVAGTLTLRGVSQPVVLDVTLNAMKRYPLPPFRRTVGFSATTTLSRRAFGITAWPGVIGDAVQVRIEAEAALDRSDSPGTPDTDPHSNSTPATKDPS